jgi:hypothetical protein
MRSGRGFKDTPKQMDQNNFNDPENCECTNNYQVNKKSGDIPDLDFQD